jgi:hypothetical protein
MTSDSTNQTLSIVLIEPKNSNKNVQPNFLSEAISASSQNGIVSIGVCSSYLCQANTTKSYNNFNFKIIASEEMNYASLAIDKVLLLTNLNSTHINGLFDVTSELSSYNSSYSLQNNRFPEYFDIHVIARIQIKPNIASTNSTVASAVID